MLAHFGHQVGADEAFQIARSACQRHLGNHVFDTAIDRADSVRTGKERGAAAVLDQLDAVAVLLEADAGAASGRDAMRFKALAATMKGRTAKLR